MKAQCVIFTAPKKAVIEEREIGEPGQRQVFIRTLKTLISIEI